MPAASCKIEDDTFSYVALKLAKLSGTVLQDFADKTAEVLPETGAAIVSTNHHGVFFLIDYFSVAAFELI